MPILRLGRTGLALSCNILLNDTQIRVVLCNGPVLTSRKRHNDALSRARFTRCAT